MLQFETNYREHEISIHDLIRSLEKDFLKLSITVEILVNIYVWSVDGERKEKNVFIHGRQKMKHGARGGKS